MPRAALIRQDSLRPRVLGFRGLRNMELLFEVYRDTPKVTSGVRGPLGRPPKISIGECLSL